jgi:hypothetical protein
MPDPLKTSDLAYLHKNMLEGFVDSLLATLKTNCQVPKSGLKTFAPSK